MKQIAIIGAGAAGLMTAASIIENTESGEYHIHIFEKNNSPGKKVIISGGGRCNLTTGIIEKKELLSNYTRGSEFIKKALGRFSPKKCFEWFETHGVPLKTQEDRRVFPCSDDGRDIVGVFEGIFKQHEKQITLHYSEGVQDIIYNNDYTIVTEKNTYTLDIVVITTGGNAYSHTGSTGDGYAFARSLGHSVTQLGPSLSSFLTEELWLQEFSGLPFENARIIFSDSEAEGTEKRISGPILLTHFGISGPLTFKVSSHLAFCDISASHKKTIFLSPIADMDFLAWESFLKSNFVLHPKKLLLSILSEKLSRRFVERFIDEYFPGIKDTFAASIPRIEREMISKLLGNGIPMTLLERRPGDEFVTAGGVETSEIESETMESKRKKNLYFGGEILDVDGYTGGFSLQLCWASGYAIGKDISKKLVNL